MGSISHFRSGTRVQFCVERRKAVMGSISLPCAQRWATSCHLFRSGGKTSQLPIPTLHSGQLYGPQGHPHLIDADVVSKGALDHWRVVIDVQDGHLQDVVLLPWRGAMVGCHNLQGGGRLESGLKGGGWMRNMESRWAVCSVGRTARSERLAGTFFSSQGIHLSHITV